MKLTNFIRDFKIVKIISINVTYEEIVLFKNTDYTDTNNLVKLAIQVVGFALPEHINASSKY